MRTFCCQFFATARNASIVAAVAWAAAASALGPHELLVLVNETSPWSVEFGRRYAAARGVPRENIVSVRLPDAALGAAGEISPDEFVTHIWTPAQAAIDARGLRSRILAWAYSADFPVRVRTQPPMSLHGATLVGGKWPDSGVIATGLWVSALYRGPVAPNAPVAAPASLEVLAEAMGALPAPPAMSLTWSGARGLGRDASLRLLERSLAADARWKDGQVVLLTGTDVRAICRQWQFDGAARELSALGVTAVVTSHPPAGVRALAGVMVGQAQPDTSRFTPFAPGAIADHLTSLAAVFHSPGQTKLTAWLLAGACSAAGTVTEPYSIWTKFPAARIFSHYANGCTLLESYYLSVRSPLQLFMVGDPLMAPMAPRPCVTVSLTGTGAVRRATAAIDPPGANEVATFLLDGRLIARQSSLRLDIDTTSLPPGSHRLRAIVSQGAAVRAQGFHELLFETGDPTRAVRIVKPAAGAVCDARRGFEVRVATGAGARAVAMFVDGRKVAEAAAGAPLRAPPDAMGLGPVELQAVAAYADGALVRSPPVGVQLEAPNRAPSVRVTPVRRDGGARGWRAEAVDPDGDPVRISWWREVGLDGHPPAFDTQGGRVRSGPQGVTFSNEEARAHAIALAPIDEAAEVCGVWTPPSAPPRAGDLSGLAAAAGEAVWFFGWSAERSAWVLGPVTISNITVRASRGWPAPPQTPTILTLRLGPDGAVEGWVGDERRCAVAKGGPKAWRRAGAVAGANGGAFSAWRIPVPEAWRVGEGRECAPPVSEPAARRLWVRASDGADSAWAETSR